MNNFYLDINHTNFKTITYDEKSTRHTDFVKNSLALNFDLGQDSNFFTDRIQRDNISQGVYELIIRGDGACWSRALWQDVFNQILDDAIAFDSFILKVVDSCDLPGLSPNPSVPQLVEKTLYILYHLRELKTEEARIDYLNHTQVDRVLIFFMRYVAAAQIEKEQKEGYYQNINPVILEEIRQNQYAYGLGVEISAFVSHFALRTSTVIEQKTLTGKSQFFYREKPQGKRMDLCVGRLKDLTNQGKIVARLPIMQGIDGHFNVLVIPGHSQEQIEARAQQKQEKQRRRLEIKKNEKIKVHQKTREELFVPSQVDEID